MERRLTQVRETEARRPRACSKGRRLVPRRDNTMVPGLDRTFAGAALFGSRVYRSGPVESPIISGGALCFLLGATRKLGTKLSRCFLRRWALALFLLPPVVAWGAIHGRVYNGTTGSFVPRVPVTLIEIGGAQGMAPVDEVYTGADGSFAFDRELGGANGRAVHGMLRAEFEGVSYSQIIAPGGQTDDVRVTVYSIAEGEELKPRVHGLLLEPEDGEMLINQFFSFVNETQPPRTFRDADRGSLRFYLPAEARSSLQVTTMGPAGMPLRGAASDTDEPDIYFVDFPLKPGENSIQLIYRVPHTDGGPYRGRVLYDGLATTVVVPPGVSVEGEGLIPRPPEPKTQAPAFGIPATREFEISISGQGRLRRSGPTGAPDSPGIEVAPAPIAQELTWVLTITGAILAIGFFRLFGSKMRSASPGGGPQVGKDGAVAKGKYGPARKASRSGRRKR